MCITTIDRSHAERGERSIPILSKGIPDNQQHRVESLLGYAATDGDGVD